MKKDQTPYGLLFGKPNIYSINSIHWSTVSAYEEIHTLLINQFYKETPLYIRLIRKCKTKKNSA